MFSFRPSAVAAVLSATLALTLTLTLAGCTGSSETTSPETSASASALGTWGDPTAADQPWLTFTEDSSVMGFDGCNTLRGGWSQTGDTVVFGPLAATQMYCENVDSWLSGAATATVRGTDLIVLDSSGDTIGTLERTR